MKRLLLTACVFFSILVCYGENTEKQYKKLIEKYDIDQAVKEIDSDNAANFWNVMIQNNELRTKFIEDIEKNKGAEKETIEKLADLPRFYPNNKEEAVVDSLQSFCDSLLIDMGIKQLNLNCSLHIVENPDPNAFTSLTNNGFAICIHTGLLNQEGVNNETLKAYVAHEFSHGILLHPARRFYDEAKKRRKNELISGFVTGASVFAVAASAFAGVATGNLTTSATDYSYGILKIGEHFDKMTEIHTFAYSREQEFEADLIAYRFMEYIGASDAYMNALGMIDIEEDKEYNVYNDHPKTSDRISFLKYVQEHPELGNKENEKRRKKIAMKIAHEEQLRLRQEKEFGITYK